MAHLLQLTLAPRALVALSLSGLALPGLALSVLALAGLAWSDLTRAQAETSTVLTAEERSTINTIPLQSLDQTAMSDTVIEGGLDPVASARSGSANSLDEGYTPFIDPLILPANDNRTGGNRFPLNVEIFYQDPKNIPGIDFSNSYNIRFQPPGRTYDFYESRTTER